MTDDPLSARFKELLRQHQEQIEQLKLDLPAIGGPPDLQERPAHKDYFPEEPVQKKPDHAPVAIDAPSSTPAGCVPLKPAPTVDITAPIRVAHKPVPKYKSVARPHNEPTSKFLFRNWVKTAASKILTLLR